VKKATKKATKKTAKKATKKTTAKKATAKKATKKVAVKKATKKAAVKKATKKTAAKKATAKKTTVKKATAKKATAKVAASKATTKKPAAKAAARVHPVPAVGSTAPGFTLRNQAGQTVSLDDFRGHKVLVYFYPRAMTPGCTVQACGLRDAKNDLAAQGIVVLGISPDEPAALQKFVGKENLNFTLLSDPEHTVATAYGAFGRKTFMGREFDGVLRQSYLIDGQGKLVHVMSKVDTQSHAQDVLKAFGSNA